MSDQSRRGAGMAGSGAVLGGTGLIAGGVPGVREPYGSNIWLLRGSTKKRRKAIANKEVFPPADPRGLKSPIHPRNLGHNAKKLGPLPRAGILGFRANIHQAFIDEHKGKTGGTAYVQGNRAGKLEAEQKIVRGMRTARRATYPLTVGGAALAATGLHRMKQSQVNKAQTRERGAGAGTAGATAGGTAGAYAGIRVGPEAGLKLANRKIRSEYVRANGPLPKNLIPHGGDTFVRRMAGVSRGLKAGVLVGTTTVGVGGYRLARGEKVDKRNNTTDNVSAAALGAGGTAAGVGHFVPKGLARFSRRYSNSAKQHVLAAQKLHPGMGGLETLPAKHDPVFGGVVRPAKPTMYPAKTDAHLRATKEADRIKGGAERRAAVGRHRGLAAQERHFVEVFDSTGKAIRRVRGPGLAVAATGAAGLLGSREVRKGFGYETKRVSPVRATEAAVGITLVGWGGSRLGLTKAALKVGSRAQGNAGILSRRAEKARKAVETTTGHGAAMLGSRLNTGFRLRPVEGAVGGGLLLNNSMPIRRSEFTPVNVRTQQGGY